MKYFQTGIFVIPGVCLIRKYGSQTTAFFLYFSASQGTVLCKIALSRLILQKNKENSKSFRAMGNDTID